MIHRIDEIQSVPLLVLLLVRTRQPWPSGLPGGKQKNIVFCSGPLVKDNHNDHFQFRKTDFAKTAYLLAPKVLLEPTGCLTAPP